jgi:hypothetical protein
MTALRELSPTSLDALDLRTATGVLKAFVTPEMYGASGVLDVDAAAAVQACFDAAASAGVSARLTGSYLVGTELVARCSIVAEPGALLKASAAIPAVLTLGDTVSLVNKDLVNLTIDADDLADRCIRLRKCVRTRIINPTLYNARSIYLDLGDDAQTFSGYEALVRGIHTERTKGSILPGSIGVRIGATLSDSIIESGIVKDAEIGILANYGNNLIQGVHAWANPAYGVMVTCFDDYASGNSWLACQADTPSTYGWRIRSALTRIVDCVVFNNSLTGSDNVVIGVHFDQTSPGVTLIGNRFYGADASHRLNKDYDISSVSGTKIFGNRNSNVTTPHATVFVASNETPQAMAFSGDTLSFNHGGTIFVGASSGSGSLEFQTNGSAPRLKLGTQGAQVPLLSSATPSSNGDMVFQKTSDTSLTVKVRGSDGVVRSASFTLV